MLSYYSREVAVVLDAAVYYTTVAVVDVVDVGIVTVVVVALLKYHNQISFSKSM